MTLHSSHDSQGGSDGVTATRGVGPYELFILALTGYVLVALVARTFFSFPDHARRTLQIVDDAVCLVFLVDVAVCAIRAPSRPRYFLTWGWVDLASSIPGLVVLRWGRLFRAWRILREVRSAGPSGTLLAKLRSQLPGSVLSATLIASVVLLVGSSLAIVEVERGVSDGNIKTAEDAVWWAFVTMTTVGYGDRYPETLAGRAIAAVLMTLGVALFGTFTSYVGAWFQRSSDDDTMSEIKALRRELAELRVLVNRLRDKLDGGDAPSLADNAASNRRLRNEEP